MIFSKTLIVQTRGKNTFLLDNLPVNVNENINGYISPEEILKCIKNLKSNLIFDTGILPQSWLSGI